MSQRRSAHERLFRAIVVMGASLGTTACGDDDGKGPPDAANPDAKVADAGSTDGGATDAPPLQDAPVDGVLIL